MTILEINHLDRDGGVLWRKEGIKNIVHTEAENFFLTCLFNTSSISVPTNYYIGLDNRTTAVASDELSNLSQEPSQYGYSRQALTSSNGFTIALNEDDIYQATSNVVTFNASGGTWGPVSKVFIATSTDSSGYLLATASLDGTHYLSDGQKLTIRMALTLTDLGTDTVS